MCRALRQILQYDPWQDIKDRFPEWTVSVVDGIGEVPAALFLPKIRKCIVSKIVHDVDPERMMSFVAAHLHLGGFSGGEFSAEQDDLASSLADVWLDRPESRDGIAAGTS